MEDENEMVGIDFFRKLRKKGGPFFSFYLFQVMKIENNKNSNFKLHFTLHLCTFFIASSSRFVKKKRKRGEKNSISDWATCCRWQRLFHATIRYLRRWN